MLRDPAMSVLHIWPSGTGALAKQPSIPAACRSGCVVLVDLGQVTTFPALHVSHARRHGRHTHVWCAHVVPQRHLCGCSAGAEWCAEVDDPRTSIPHGSDGWGGGRLAVTVPVVVFDCHCIRSRTLLVATAPAAATLAATGSAAARAACAPAAGAATAPAPVRTLDCGAPSSARPAVALPTHKTHRGGFAGCVREHSSNTPIPIPTKQGIVDCNRVAAVLWTPRLNQLHRLCARSWEVFAITGKTFAVIEKCVTA